MGTVMEPHVRGLFDVMFSAGLSPTLVEALEQITIRYTMLFLNLHSHHFRNKSF